MSGQVARYCQGCEECQSKKDQTGVVHAPLNPHDIPSEPWQNVSVDFIGPLPNLLGYTMVMVVVDMLMKEVVLMPCSHKISGEGTARLLFKHIVPCKGLFRKVMSD